MSNPTLQRLQTVFQEVFDDEDITLTRGTTAKDVPAWDSIMHVSLMIAVERAFRLRFKSGDVAGLKNVGELVDLIDQRKPA